MIRLFIILFLPYTLWAQPFIEDVAHIVRRANVVYDLNSFQTGHPHVPPLVSNGIIGACFDHMGFQSRPKYGVPEGRTILGYVQHYERHVSSRQIQFPLAYIQAEFADGSSILNLMDMTAYKQELDLYTGTLHTNYELFGETSITTFAHQTIPNLLVMKINRSSSKPGKKVIIKINCETSPIQNNGFLWPVQPIQLQFQRQNAGKVVEVASTTNLTETNWIVQSNNEVRVEGQQLIISLEEEENILKIWMDHPGSPDRKVLSQSFESLHQSHKDAWEEVWQTSWMNFPEDRAQKIWTRGKYHALSHFPLIPEKPLIPTGFSGNIWGFTFPQDVYYVAENLPRLGHFNRSEKAMQYWLEVLGDVKNYTQRIMDVEGGFYPWTPPYKDWNSYEKDGVVSPDSYELHNPAYVATMVWHHYQTTQDKAFLEKYFPIMEAVFEFYKNISSKTEEGTYDVYHEHARGQDEASTTDGKLRNLLCASYSAEYSTRIYIQACKKLNKNGDLLNEAKLRLNDGYTRATLLKPDGIYRTYERDIRPYGKQKHPVQLNPIAYLPMPDLVTANSPVEKAWQNRFDLVIDANKPLTLGWTIGEFALASCRMQDPYALEKDLLSIQPCRGADPRWIQFYESSFWEGWHLHKAYYLPMIGLYVQTFTDIVVQDWQGYVELFPCLLPTWETQSFSFHGIHAKGGVEVSGKWFNGQFEVVLTPNNANEVELKIGKEFKGITATGQASGPKQFDGEKLVHFDFNDKDPIVIQYHF